MSAIVSCFKAKRIGYEDNVICFDPNQPILCLFGTLIDSRKFLSKDSIIASVLLTGLENLAIFLVQMTGDPINSLRPTSTYHGFRLRRHPYNPLFTKGNLH